MTLHPSTIRILDENYFARLTHRLRERLPMWTVYRPITREYPGLWVTRMHVSRPIPRPTRYVLTHDSLDELRGILPPGMWNLGRMAGDVEEIEEVWLA